MSHSRGGADAEGLGETLGGETDQVKQLLRQNQELAAAVSARDAFLAMAAHELRNPMTPLLGQVQRLRRLVEARSSTMEEVEQGLRRLEWLVELYLKRATTLLDVSRITSGRLRLQIESVDIGEVVRNVVAVLQPAAHHSGSHLRLEIEDRLVLPIDRLAIEQILDNLLLNALKYGAGKPIDLRVAREAEVLSLSVRDRGIGMTSTDQARIFEPFERAISYGSQAGFGVGLWVVRQLVDAMGGNICVESEVNMGTTFTVALPQQSAEPR